MKNTNSLIRPPVGDMTKDEWLHAAYLANMESIHNVYADVRDVKLGYKTEEEAKKELFKIVAEDKPKPKPILITYPLKITNK